MNRKHGWYWVKPGNEWMPALWNGVYFVAGANMRPEHLREIGPWILTPDEMVTVKQKLVGVEQHRDRLKEALELLLGGRSVIHLDDAQIARAALEEAGDE